MAQDTLSGPMLNVAGYGIGNVAGAAGSYANMIKTVQAIPDTTATTVLLINVPNFNQSAVIRLLLRTGVTAVGHIYDSTRVSEWFVVVTRVAGVLSVCVISAVVGAQIATIAAGSTLTSTLTIATVTGGAAATNVFAVQVANVGTPAGISETTLFAEVLNATGVLPIGANAVNVPTGVTVS